jgi:hypothetical protein
MKRLNTDRLFYLSAMSETEDLAVNVDGHEVDAETIVEMADELLEEDGRGREVTDGVAVVNSVTAADDGDNDTAVYMSGESWQSDGYVYLSTLKEKAEEEIEMATKSDFAAYIEDNYRVTVTAEGNDTMFNDGEMDVKSNQHRDVFGSGTIKSMQDDENVQLSYIANTGANHNDYEEEFTVVGLLDQRNE